jgi:hypothetical protein
MAMSLNSTIKVVVAEADNHVNGQPSRSAWLLNYQPTGCSVRICDNKVHIG